MGLQLSFQNQTLICTVEAWMHLRHDQRKHTKVKAMSSQCWLYIFYTLFFYYEGLAHHQYAPEGQTINKEYNPQVMKILCDRVNIICGNENKYTS